MESILNLQLGNVLHLFLFSSSYPFLSIFLSTFACLFFILHCPQMCAHTHTHTHNTHILMRSLCCITFWTLFIHLNVCCTVRSSTLQWCLSFRFSLSHPLLSSRWFHSIGNASCSKHCNHELLLIKRRLLTSAYDMSVRSIVRFVHSFFYKFGLVHSFAILFFHLLRLFVAIFSLSFSVFPFNSFVSLWFSYVAHSPNHIFETELRVLWVCECVCVCE